MPVYRKGSNNNYQQIAANSQEFSVIEPGVLLTDDETGYRYWSVFVEPKDLEDNEAIAFLAESYPNPATPRGLINYARHSPEMP